MTKTKHICCFLSPQSHPLSLSVCLSLLTLSLLQALKQAGVIAGGDMTAEAALAKLEYVLGKDEWTLDQKKKVIMNKKNT